jgi:hypothetical protein
MEQQEMANLLSYLGVAANVLAAPQELSVWAGSASNQQHQQQPWADARSGSSRSKGPEATGLVARNLMAAYAELQSVMEAVGTIMMQHQALKVSVAEQAAF